MVWTKNLTLGVVLLALTGCATEGDRAAEAFEIAEKGMNYEDACDQAHRAKNAYLAERDEKNYNTWVIEAYNACSHARRGG